MMLYCPIILRRNCSYINPATPWAWRGQGAMHIYKKWHHLFYLGIRTHLNTKRPQTLAKKPCETSVGSLIIAKLKYLVWGLRLATTAWVQVWLHIHTPGSRGVLGKGFLSLGTFKIAMPALMRMYFRYQCRLQGLAGQDMTFVDDNSRTFKITSPSDLCPSRPLTQDQERRLLIM